MKLKILLVMVTVVSIATLFMVYSGNRKKMLNDLMSENVEALAAGEYGTAYQCWGSGSMYCPYSGRNVYMILTGYSLE